MGKAVTKASRARSKERAQRVARKQPARGQRPLPAMWQGANVLRGEPLPKGTDLDDFLETHALDTLSGIPEVFLVVEDKAFEDIDDSTQIFAFTDAKIALTVAKARSCGNVDHRVLRCVEQTLVVATDNDL